MATVALEKVVKRYGSTRVVHGIDLAIADNEFIVLVGPSGCGKSTTLRMVAGLESISDGRICIDGEVVNDVPPKDRNIAMVFQNYALYPHMSVFDNMAFGLKMQKRPVAEIRETVQQAADVLGLTDFLDRKPAALSGGQRQRVAMGRSIVRRPKVFLFDEPLSNLDAQLRTQMRMELKKLHLKLKTTTIYVTHDQVEAMTLADRIVILKDGFIQQVGTPVMVYDHPANVFVAGFIGNPPMNIFPARLAMGEGKRWLQFGPHRFPLPDTLAVQCGQEQAVLAGLRPDAIQPVSAANGAPEAWQISGTVAVAEVMGGRSLLELELGEQSMIAETAGHILVDPGTSFTVTLDLNQLHLFDPQSEATLIAGPGTDAGIPSAGV